MERSSRALMHLAAGVLRRPELAWAIGRRWQDFGVRESHVVSGFSSWERDFYGAFLKPGDSVLVVGSGTGRELVALARDGHAVSGLELSERSTAIARSLLTRYGLSASLTVGSVEEVTPSGPFDVILFSWFCYSYIPGRSARIEALRRVGDRLAPGGRVLISYVPSDTPPRRLPLSLLALVASLSRSGWRPEPTDVVSLVGAGLHFEHQSLAGEVDAEAAAAGFDVLFHRPDEGTVVLTRGAA